MRQHKVKETPPNPKSFTNRFRRMRGSEKRHIDYMKYLYTAALLFTFGKTVDESRAWLKRIIITWAILNGLGFIMAYITPFFAGGQWNG